MITRSFLALLSLSFLFTSCLSNNSNKKEEYKSHFPNEDYFNQRNYPETSFDHKAYFKQIDEVRSNPANRVFSGVWEDQGPGNIGARINKIAINPNNENEIYLGYARGGLYKTTDGGSTWTDMFKEFSYLSISHIEIDPNDTNTIYIGTGDENISHYPGIGNGVYKSTDGGLNWEHLGLAETGIISKVSVSAQDDKVLYASAMGIPFEKNDDRGLYKSIDGGANWDQVLFVNDSTGIIDMVVAPGNSDIIYAAGWNRLRNNNISKVTGPDAKIWKTEDGGDNWTLMETGLPEGEFVRIGLGMFGEDGQTVYASYSASGSNEFCNASGINFYGLYKTTDGGDNWERTEAGEDTGLSCDFTGGFAWYFSKMSVNPLDENDICLAGVYMHRFDTSIDRWVNMVWEVNNGVTPHVDFHDMVYYGENLYAATDGGAYRYNETEGWVDIENISTNQFYRVEYNNHAPDLYYGGLQDNGVVEGSGSDINGWNRISGGDGFQLRFDPIDPDYVYTESQNGALRVSTDGGDSFTGFTQGLQGDRNWDMQYILSPHDPKIRFTGTDKMYMHIGNVESDDWISISEDLTDAAEDPLGFYEHNITCLSQSPINPDYLYCGTSDGLVWRTKNGSNSYEKINDGLPRRYITEVKASPTYEEVVFVTVSGYKNNDFVPHIFRSDNVGDTWIDISGNLPEFAINDVYILPGFSDQYIFIATEIGVYLTIDGGVNWERLGDDFPFIQCLDLEYNDINNQLIVGTYGKGLRTFDLIQLAPIATSSLNVTKIISIAPNIATDKINIIAQGKYDQLSIIDANGKLIQSIRNDETEINISYLANGTYFIQVRDGEKIQVEKFIKM